MNMTWFFDLLSTALYTVFIQNLVFNGGYAASEALMLAKKPRRLWMFSAMIAFFSTVTALACRALEMIPVLSTLPSALHFAMFSGVLIVAFLITGLILKLALGATEKFLGTLGMAAGNHSTATNQNGNINLQFKGFNDTDSIIGIGAGLAFILAATLICKGLHIISQNQDMPKAFRGTPAAFVYVALLSLAFSGFSGSSLFS